MKNPTNKSVLFINQKRATDKQPHYTGSIYIEREMIIKFLEETKLNLDEPMKLETMLYENIGKIGNTYYTLYVKRPTVFKRYTEPDHNKPTDDGFVALSKLSDDYPF